MVLYSLGSCCCSLFIEKDSALLMLNVLIYKKKKKDRADEETKGGKGFNLPRRRAYFWGINTHQWSRIRDLCPWEDQGKKMLQPPEKASKFFGGVMPISDRVSKTCVDEETRGGKGCNLPRTRANFLGEQGPSVILYQRPSQGECKTWSRRADQEKEGKAKREWPSPNRKRKGQQPQRAFHSL